MKVVQTELNEVEYKMLKQLAQKRKKTIKELVREAIRKILREEKTINPDDPIFTEPPVIQEEGEIENTSETHDKVLYGE